MSEPKKPEWTSNFFIADRRPSLPLTQRLQQTYTPPPRVPAAKSEVPEAEVTDDQLAMLWLLAPAFVQEAFGRTPNSLSD